MGQVLSGLYQGSSGAATLLASLRYFRLLARVVVSAAKLENVDEVLNPSVVEWIPT
jgi:hypothetical protein